MARKKGRFITTKAKVRGSLSSARLKSWHDERKSLVVENINNDVEIVNSNDVPDVAKEVNAGPPENVLSGRRIVELGHIADQLKMCTNCHFELNLTNTTKEDRYGNQTIKQLEITTGMVHSGIGLAHINNFMSTLEVPTIHHKTMKTAESKVGQHVISVAKSSCKKAIHLEEEMMQKKMCDDFTDQNDTGLLDETATGMSPIDSAHQHDTASLTPDKEQNDGVPPQDHSYSRSDQKKRTSGQFKYDMGWQKRGSGRCYDSRSGVGTMFGNMTGKICAYGKRSKCCRKCDYHSAEGSDIPDHRCCKNWGGSSKAMEPDVGGELVKEIEKENVEIGTIIMDDDCTTMSRIRKELPHSVEKWSDQNHTVKNLGNSLYTLQKKHKVLSTMVINHIQKCFNYALAQNKGNVANFSSALKQVVPHLFGDHNMCGEWCGYRKSPETYKHRGLPYGRPLCGETLRSDLDSVLHIFIQNAAKIAPGGSTKDVESFNNMVASKAPKRTHYSGSESLYIRTSCAVAQKNVGCSYVNKVNSHIGISPGRIFQEHANKLDRKRQRKNEVENNIDFKRRKLERKLQQKKDNSSKAIREGPTYESGVAMTHVSDVTEIPVPKNAPAPDKIDTENLLSVNKIYCDIETTSLHKDADILQIAAINETDSCNLYILPSKPISQAASDITGLTIIGNNMLYQGRRVDTHSLQEALNLFVEFLENHQPCILIGHNFKRFDFPRIIRAFKLTNMTDHLYKYTLGIVDTLPLFKDTHQDLEKYSQEHLVGLFVKESYSAHNALSDVESLQKLCTTVGVTNQQMSEHSCSVHSALDIYQHRKESQQNIDTLVDLKQNKVLSKGMADKIGESGLCLAHLKLAIQRSGLTGLSQLLSEPFHGKPRVTKNRKITEKLYDYLKQ